MKKFLTGLAVIFFWSCILYAALSNDENPEEVAESPKQDKCVDGYDTLTTDERLQCAVKKHFDPWTGEHIYAVEELKKQLKDPDSLKIEATKYGLNDDSEEKQYYRVVMKFRSKNSFGGYVLSYAGASCDLKTGRVLDLQIDD